MRNMIAGGITLTVTLALMACSRQPMDPGVVGKLEPSIASQNVAGAALVSQCKKVVAHMYALEARAIAPTKFANPAQRQQMLMRSCQKFGLARGEADCLLAAKRQADLGKCRSRKHKRKLATR